MSQKKSAKASKTLLCSYCNISPVMLTCRDCQKPAICYGCVVAMPTGGQCRTCFEEFKYRHLPNHIEQFKDQKWLDAYAEVEEKSIEEFGKKRRELDSIEKNMNWKVVDSEPKNVRGPSLRMT